ncbi:MULTISPECIES: rubredoxin [Cupriavidus]|uniref:rubredoxin n=1 Tax=Cupriavidus sp. WS TaxID=1312922 RepID=UPI00036858EA|nr:rubredoxin [Cupriavidus sp. WS]
MYKKGTAIELQFSPARLNDGAGDPYWIDLTTEEARQLLAVLQDKLAHHGQGTDAPAIFSLDEPGAATAPPSAPSGASEAPPPAAPADEFRQWVCIICGWVYDEAAGLPEEGIPPGTRWEDIPDDWRCPLCDVGKEDFAMVAF